MSVQASKSRSRRASFQTLTVGAAVALLAGCSYQVERVDNPVRMPVAWDAPLMDTATPGVSRDWWTAFNSPVLNGLIEQAFRDSPTIIDVEERLKQTERTFRNQRESLLPDLTATASTQRTLSGGNQRPESTSDSTSLSLNTGYNVDLFGGQAALYRQRLAAFTGTQYQAEQSRIVLAANIARAYFALLSVRTQVDIARRNLAIAEDALRIIDARYRNGVLREFDLRQQTTSVLQQRTSLIPLENSMRQAETALGILLGQVPQEFFIEGEPIEQLQVPEIAPWAPAELLLRRPDMAIAEMTMSQARANLAVARATLIPVTLNLTASGNTGSQELISLTDARTYSVAGVLRIADGIFSYRARRNNILNAESSEYVALVQYASTIRSALKDVDDTLATAHANLRAEESQRETTEQARRALQLAEITLREGSGTTQSVLDAQRALFTAEQQLSQARVTRLNTAVNLSLALGGGWISPNP